MLRSLDFDKLPIPKEYRDIIQKIIKKDVMDLIFIIPPMERDIYLLKA